MKNIVLYGAPGSGKSTLIELLQEKGISFTLISPGQMCRDIVKNEDTELSHKIRETMARGDLVDDFVINELVKKGLREADKSLAIVSDSYPRNLSQLEIVDDMFSDAGYKLPILVYITITKEEAVRRLSSRRVCSKCKENFQYEELEDKEKCAACGGELIQREDDKPETIEKRFELFEMQFRLIRHYFKSKGRYVEIDGAMPKPERVAELIKIIQD